MYTKTNKYQTISRDEQKKSNINAPFLLHLNSDSCYDLNVTT
jgi:hypothetical protein